MSLSDILKSVRDTLTLDAPTPEVKPKAYSTPRHTAMMKAVTAAANHAALQNQLANQQAQLQQQQQAMTQSQVQQAYANLAQSWQGGGGAGSPYANATGYHAANVSWSFNINNVKDFVEKEEKKVEDTATTLKRLLEAKIHE